MQMEKTRNHMQSVERPQEIVDAATILLSFTDPDIGAAHGILKKRKEFVVRDNMETATSGSSSSEEPTRTKGTSQYINTKRWEAVIWIPALKKQQWIASHFIREAALRCYDKAQLVLREEKDIELNYPLEDYDSEMISKWKNMTLRRFIMDLREQSRKESEGCIKGLTPSAAAQLLQKIGEAKQNMKPSRVLFKERVKYLTANNL